MAIQHDQYFKGCGCAFCENARRSQEIRLYPIAYPDRRMVSRQQLTLWASDAIANGDTSIEATNEELEESFALVRQVLDDSGYATVVGPS